MQERIVIRVITHILAPFIILYACYIQLHGEYSPGGGFQAGVILAAAFIGYGLVFGQEKVQHVLSLSVAKILACIGVLTYAGVGLVTLALGGNFLEYNALNPEHPVHGQHLGITVIELGVGLTVFAVMVVIFYVFVDRETR